MSVSQLTITAPEEGTYAITAVFVDEDGDPLVPVTLEWGLHDLEGTAINGHDGSGTGDDIVPASSITVVLQGDDLAITGEKESERKRRFTIIGTYNSDLGMNLPLTAECEFTIDKFVGVP